MIEKWPKSYNENPDLSYGVLGKQIGKVNTSAIHSDVIYYKNNLLLFDEVGMACNLRSKEPVIDARQKAY